MIARLARFVLRAAVWAVDRFYEVGRVGSSIPSGPILIIANHPNSLMDGLIVMKVAGRRVRPLGKAPLFEQSILGDILRGLDALPVYRPQDYPGETWRNESTFSAAVAALGDGDAVLIFPEGLSHSETRLAKIKTGAARLALEAEEAADWKLGLRIVPIGLTYQRKHAFRGAVAVSIGEPLLVAGWRERRERDAWGTVESLTAAMREALEDVTVNVPTRQDRVLVETAEKLYAAEKGLSSARAREGLAPRLRRLQRFARGLALLRVTDPEAYEKLAAQVQSYRHRLLLLGVSEGELPRRFPPSVVLRYVVVEGVILLLGLPLAVAGTVVWYLPYKSPKLSLDLYRPVYEAVASVKLATALVAFPLTYAAWLALAWWAGGVRALVVVAIVLPLLGLVALFWRNRWSAVREDVRVWWRALRARRLRGEMVRRRQELVREFDELARRWQAERGSAGASARPSGHNN